MQWINSARCTVSETDEQRKRVLECARLAADCEQLARSTDNLDLKAHFTGAAQIWMKLAEDGEDAGFGTAPAH